MDEEELEELYSEIFSVTDAKKIAERILEERGREVESEGREKFFLGLSFGLAIGFLLTTILYIIIAEIDL